MKDQLCGVSKQSESATPYSSTALFLAIYIAGHISRECRIQCFPQAVGQRGGKFINMHRSKHPETTSKEIAH